MASRLRRMLLVNTKTSGAHTSLAINELDPRGGAAITGDNAVGKTTTLQLIPLFFGTLPSHIVEALGQREPMLDYVLPQPQSAIVFEYQRGNDESHDLRCAILRRHTDGAPRYRFFSGPFDEAHFITTLPSGERAFCDDSQMVDAMNIAGSPASSLFSIADYRYIILAQKANKENYRRLRDASARYSFATRSLTNLDRLIESVVKEEVSFKDFILLASTIVQERMGGVRESSLRGKLALKQSRAQIEQWLEDREACERAFALEPQVAKLREDMASYHNTSSELAESKFQVAPLHGAVSAKLSDAERILSDLRTHHLTQGQILEDDLKGLDAIVSNAVNAKRQAEEDVKGEQARQEALQLESVAQWDQDLATLKDRSGRLSLLASEIDVAQGKSSDIDAGYQKLIQQAGTNLNEEIARINLDAQVPQAALNAENADAENWGRDRLQSLEIEHLAQTEDLNDRLNQANGDHRVAKERSETAQASQDDIDSLESARLKFQDHSADLLAATTAHHQTRSALGQNESALAEAQRALAQAQNRVSAAEDRLQKASFLLKPQDGSLLATLRERADDGWKADIARVLDPALLARTDLSPTFEGESDGTAYGLSLDTALIEAPQWTDDTRLREDMEAAQASLDDSVIGLSKAKERLDTADGNVRAAQQAELKARQHFAATNGLGGARKAAVADALDRVKKSKEATRDKFAKEASQLDAKIKQLLDQKGNLTRIQGNEKTSVQAEIKRQKDEAAERFRVAKDALSKREADARKACQEKIDSLQLQRTNALAAEGVDVPHLDALREQSKMESQSILEIESRRPVVNLWKAWLTEGGHSILKTLQTTLDDASGALSKTSSARLDRAEAGRIQLGEINSQIDTANKRVLDLQGDISILDDLKIRHGIADRSIRQLTTDLTPEGLRNTINTLLARQEHAEETVRVEFSRLRNQLTARQSAVKDLFEQSLSGTEDSSVVSRAAHLCDTHRLVARELLPNIVNSAESIVEHIRQFRQRIHSFEREVNTFNGQFQAGLDKISGFKRIKDFKVQVATDFSKVNFLKSLDLVDAVGRDQAFDRTSNETPVLPSAQTAQALRNFSSLLKETSTLEIELGRHITLRGSATVNDVVKPFANEVDLQHIASTGLNAIILITLLSGMLNMIRGDEEVHIPWTTDEVGKFDASNFRNLMDVLRANHIDIVTASPKLTIAEFKCFNNRYIFRDRGAIARYADPARRISAADIQEPA